MAKQLGLRLEAQPADRRLGGQHEHRGALGHHEPGAVDAERPAGLGGIGLGAVAGLACSRAFMRGEAVDDRRREGALAGPAEGEVGIAGLQRYIAPRMIAWPPEAQAFVGAMLGP